MVILLLLQHCRTYGATNGHPAVATTLSHRTYGATNGHPAVAKIISLE
ncbi:MAG: hypothetical protein IPN36_18335 [Bacteroidetes bacterium]|nr:hypothetical protein [Bacteroidota bacterium]